MKIALLVLAALVMALAAVWRFQERSTVPLSIPSAPRTAAESSQPAAQADTKGSARQIAGEINNMLPPRPAAPSLAESRVAPDSATKSADLPTSRPTVQSTLVPSSAPSTSTLLPGGTPPPATTAAGADAVAGAAIEYEIPAGMRAPVVLLPEDRPLTPQIQSFLDDVRREFDATIAAADDPAAVWEDAREQADARYRQLFGDEAYNRKTMQDAIEALQSKGALPATSPVPSSPVIPAPQLGGAGGETMP